jgi:hypothetical protein
MQDQTVEKVHQRIPLHTQSIHWKLMDGQLSNVAHNLAHQDGTFIDSIMFLTLTNRKHKGLATQWLLVDD